MNDDDFEFDEGHPIPNLDVCDVRVVYKSGGSKMAITIASPLQDDHRSLERLMCKIERYLAFLRSPECIAECGEPKRENTTIDVKLHPGSSHAAFELLERCKPWVAENDVTLVIDTAGVVHCEH